MKNDIDFFILLNFGVMLSLLTLSIYHFFIYLSRKKYNTKSEISSLYYALALFCLVVYLFLIPFFINNIFYLNQTAYKIFVVIRIIVISILMFSVFNLVNGLIGFPNNLAKIYNFFSIIIYCIVTLFSFSSFLISLNFYEQKMIKINFIIIMFAVVIYIISHIICIIINKIYLKKYFMFVILGIALLIISTIFSVFYKIYFSGYYSNNFIVLYIVVIFITLALTGKFNREFIELIELKSTLEQKVLDRTHQFEQANQQLKDENQKRIDFFINLAHETRTPLTLIDNYLNDYIKKQKPSTELNVIKSNFEKLLNDMVNYLDIEKLNRGQIFYDHSQIIDLANILKNKVELFNIIARKRSINIMLSINAENIYTKIDSFAIDRIINNLFDNAIKYNKDGGKINIFLNAFEDRIELIIKDTGIGISDDQIKNIFKEYHQMSHEKRQIQGLGMGLSIVKKIIEQVNGDIKVDSILNEGTIFKITFQKYILQNNDKIQKYIEPSKPRDIPTVELKTDSYNENKSNIFAIEDNIEFLYFLQISLSDKYNFFYAFDGKQALDKIMKIPEPDLIIADIMMPVMDGFSFYDELIKMDKFKLTPFIFLTAKTASNDKLIGLKKGAFDYITKPIVIEELTSKIDTLIKNQKAQKKAKEKEVIESLQDFVKRRDKKENNNDILEKTFEEICNELNITHTEKEIIKLLKQNKTYKEIASKFNKSIHTIKNHISNIHKKCNINNNYELNNIFPEF